MIQDQINAAREHVNSKSDSTIKTSIINRLNVIQAEINQLTETEDPRKLALKETDGDRLKYSLYILPPFI